MESNTTRMETNLSTTTKYSNVSELLSADLTSKVPKVSFLLLFAVCGLVGNGLLLMVLLRGKKSVVGIIIINLSVVGLCECWLNMSMVFGALVSDSWVFGDPMCKFNAFCMSVVFIELVLTLLCISVERFIAMKHCIHPKDYLTIPRILLVIVYTWIHSISFSLPLLIGAVPTTYRQSLHLCSISDSSSFIFICLTSVICFIIPIITMMVLYILIIRYTFTERQTVQTIIAQNHYTEKQSQTIDIQNEINMSKYGGLLFCVWFVLGVPYIITAYIRQYQYSFEFQANNFLKLVDYPWSVDVTFVYLRFCFSVLFPGLTFFLINNLWMNLKDTLFCRRNNSISDVLSQKNTQPVSKQKTCKGVVIRGSTTDSHHQFFNVPVLFATSDGIHIETYSDSDRSTAGSKTEETVDIHEKSVISIKSIPKGKACDVGPLVELDYSHYDTSDYDSSSEVDVYSSSQPVTMKQVTQETITRRSVSQPEVHKSKTYNSQIISLKNVKKSFGTDSGLDLTITGKDNSLKRQYNRGIERDKSTSNRGSISSIKGSEDFANDKPVSLSPRGKSFHKIEKSPTPDNIENRIPTNCQKVDETSSTSESELFVKTEFMDSPNLEMSTESSRVNSDYVSVSQRVKNNGKAPRGFPYLESEVRSCDNEEFSVTNENIKEIQSKFVNCESDISKITLPNQSLTSGMLATEKVETSFQNFSVENKPLNDNRKKSKTKSSKFINLGETFNIPAKHIDSNSASVSLHNTMTTKTDSKMTSSKVKGHQRHDTSDSQKSLLGSGSSCELASMKASSFPDNGKTHSSTSD